MDSYSSITIFQRVTHHIIENYKKLLFTFASNFQQLIKTIAPLLT